MNSIRNVFQRKNMEKNEKQEAIAESAQDEETQKDLKQSQKKQQAK